MRKLKQYVVVSQIGQTGHLLCQLVGNLVQLLHHKTALAGVQAHEIIVELPEEILVVISLPWNLSLTLTARLVGKRNTTEETVHHVLLIKRTGRFRDRTEGDVGPQQRISGDSLLRSSHRATTFAVIYVTDSHADILMSTTYLICHFYLRQVQILRAATHVLQSQGILQESCCRGIGRGEPYGDLGTLGLILVLAPRLTLPVKQFLILNLVVVSERAHDSLYEIVQLVLADTRRAYQMAHLTAKFVIFVVAIHELHVA